MLNLSRQPFAIFARALGTLCAVGLVIAGCHKRDRLSTSTFNFSITPPAASVLRTDSLTLVATGRTAGGSVDVNPTWTVSPSSAGTLTPDIGSTVVFQPAALGDATITATFDGLAAASQIAVVGYIPTQAKFNVYTDQGLPVGAGILSNIFLSIDASCNATFSFRELSSGYTPEGIKYLDSQNFSSGSFWGVTLDSATATVPCGATPPTNGFSKDLSSFSAGSVVFALKLGRTLDASESLSVNLADNSHTVNGILASGSDGYNRLNTEWQEISIPISRYAGLDLTHVKVPFSIASSSLSSPLSFDVDAVRWSN